MILLDIIYKSFQHIFHTSPQSFFDISAVIAFHFHDGAVLSTFAYEFIFEAFITYIFSVLLFRRVTGCNEFPTVLTLNFRFFNYLKDGCVFQLRAAAPLNFRISHKNKYKIKLLKGTSISKP